jgi:hypothetical protein
MIRVIKVKKVPMPMFFIAGQAGTCPPSRRMERQRMISKPRLSMMKKT